MGRLSLSLLGPFQATLDREPITAFESNKVRALLAYLTVEADRPHSREKLAGLLWPERPEQDATANLRYALSNLRGAIGDRTATDERCAASPPVLLVSRQTIQFNSASDAWVDVTAFAKLLASPSPGTSDLEQAVDLYRGEFLEGFFVGDSAAFEEWALLQRERFHRQVLSVLQRLVAIYERRGEYEHALPYAWRQVELDSWREEVHRQLMRLLALSGQRAGALAQYEACRKALVEELGVEPARATTRLYEQIRAGELDPERVEVRPVAPGTRAAGAPHISAPALTPRPSARQRRSKWRGALAGALLLLVAAAAFLLAGGTGLFEKTASGPLPVPSLAGTVLPPEGSLLVGLCNEWRPRSADDEKPPQICVMDVRGDRVQAVTDDLEFEEVGCLGWSPDGQQIVFVAIPREGGERIYAINIDGSNLRQVAEAPASEPAWSPDGQWIAFVRRTELWLVHPDGAEAHVLLAKGALYTRAVVWSPDSQRIAFLRATSEVGSLHDEVWVVNPDGSDPRLLYSPVRPADTVVDLAWSLDGRQVGCFFVHEGEGKVTGLLIDADGSGEPQVVEERPASWWFRDRRPRWGDVK